MITVELPAPVGAKVYIHDFFKFEENIITGYLIGANGVEAVYYQKKGDDDPNWGAWLEDVDFTREDAEKRLKKRLEGRE